VKIIVQKKPRRPAKKPSAAKLARVLAQAALAMKAQEVVILDVAGIIDYTDFFLIASGRSTRQAQAIAENVARAIHDAGVRVFGIEGEDEGNWILIDGGAVIAHVFYQPAREFYELDQLWGDAKRTVVADGDPTE
jgi:ribosome-associated protein